MKTTKRMEQLWRICEEWIREHEVSSPESVMQVDSVNESLPDLADKILRVVGTFNHDTGKVR